MKNRFANFLPLIFYQRSLVTPIHCPIKTNRISQQEFKILANEVIGHAVAIHARKQKAPPTYMTIAPTIADWGFHGQDNCGGCGGSTTPILEGSAVQLWAYPQTMGRPGDRVIFRADTNFNRTFEPEEIKTVDVANGQHFNFSFPVADDGASPGDDQPTGTMAVEVDFIGDVNEHGDPIPAATDAATVFNVAPRLTSRPTVNYGTNTDGNPTVTVTVEIHDPGVRDNHTLEVLWSDGVTTEIDDDIDELIPAERTADKTIELTRVLAVGAAVRPVTVSVRDDDDQAAVYQMLRTDVRFNNNDDNGLPGVDMFEQGEEDPDLVEIDLTSMLLNPPPNPSSGRYVLSYNPSRIRVWDSQDKQNLFRTDVYFGYSGDSSGSFPGGLGIAYDGRASIWLEGMNLEENTLYLNWITDDCSANSALSALGNVRVNVVGVDLDVDSDNTGTIDSTATEEADEMRAPGKILMLNRNDTNQNGIRDLSESGPFIDAGGNPVNDVELQPIDLRMNLDFDDFNGHILSIETIGTSIELFASQNKQPTPTIFAIGIDPVPTRLFAEGVVSGQGIVRWVLRNGDIEVHSDEVLFSVIDVNLTAFRQTTAEFTSVEIEENPLSTTVVGIRRNGDDDDNDTIIDGLDVNVPNEDDLIRVSMTTSNRAAPGVRYELSRGTTDINVWTNPNSSAGAILDLTSTELSAALPSGGAKTENVFVEWSNLGANAAPSVKLQLFACDSLHNRLVLSDTLVFDPFDSIVIVLGGMNQVPTDPPIEPNNHGTFNFAIDVYRNDGYDVFMYDEDAVNGTLGVGDGSSPAHAEIVEAINHRGVTQVAIMGYSRGGGATYNLSLRLNENVIGNLTEITRPFTVPFTSYVDAVSSASAGAENRRPLLSLFHTNQYQVNDWLLTGGPSNGDDELNRSPLNNYSIGHLTIDDHAFVLGLLRDRLRQKVSR